MATTTYGTPYVQSSDLVSAYPGTSSTLATRIDDISLKGNGVNAQTASYTLVLTDGGKTITMTNAAATTLTVPTNASVAFPTGVGIVALNLGAGTMTVSGAGGVTVNGASLAVAQYESITLRKTDTNTWVAVKGGGLPKASVTATTGSPTVTTVSGKTCYQFTGSGSITIGGNGGTCDVLVVAGGGGGMNTVYNFGGGAGGYQYKTSLYLPSGSHTVTVGGGGTGSATSAAASNGNDSLIGTAVRSYRGGGGGDYSNGASSGGGSIAARFPSLPDQGNNGYVGSPARGGGAGGAATSGAVGAGVSNSITGSAVTYSTGGNWSAANVAPANSGQGGSGRDTESTNGGSGVVIILIG